MWTDTPVAWHALFLGLVPSSGEPAAANPKHSKILSRQCKLASGKLNFLAVAEYPRSKMLKGYLTQFLKGLHIILSPLRLQFWSKLACLTMRNTTFENFPIAITLAIPTYNTHALQLQNPIVTTQQLHHHSNQGICMSWQIILIYIYTRENHTRKKWEEHTRRVWGRWAFSLGLKTLKGFVSFTGGGGCNTTNI